MARTVLLVLLFAVAVSSGFAQKGSLSALARGGYRYMGTDGEGAGSISGEIKLGTKERSADVMFVLKDVGNATLDGQNEAIVFLKSVVSYEYLGNKLIVVGKGTFQGEPRDVEMTFLDSRKPKVADQIRVRVLRSGRVEFDHSAKLESGVITINKQ